MLIRPLQSLLILIPVGVMAVLVATHAVNVPFWDQWELVPLLERQRAGTLGLTDFFHQHNEHRMVFPGLIMVGLATLTGWDIRAELAVNLVLAVAALAVVLAMLRPVLAGAGPWLRLWAPFAVASLLFSPVQWENWLWGWQIQWFLSLLATLGGVALLARALEASNPWPSLAAAAACVVVVQFSVASGIALWPAGLMVIALHSRPRRRGLALVWSAVAAASCAVFFTGWHRIALPGAPSPLAVLGDPVLLFGYVGNYLASPLARGPLFGVVQPAVIGLGLAGVVLAAAGWLLVTRWRERAAVLPWLALAAFAGANALVTGLGRAVFGIEQALGSRYTTLGQLAALAALALVILVLRGAGRRGLPAGAVPALLFSALILSAGHDSLPSLEGRAGQLAAGRDCLLSGPAMTDACLGLVYPEPSVVRARLPTLQAFGWSGFPPAP